MMTRYDDCSEGTSRIAVEDRTTPSEVVREAVRRYVKAQRRRRAKPGADA